MVVRTNVIAFLVGNRLHNAEANGFFSRNVVGQKCQLRPQNTSHIQMKKINVNVLIG